MATNRLYSFRFPFDIQSTLESWRDKLASPLSDRFDTVIARLSDRDRALEDHVNLGMSQGRLAYATSTTTNSFAATNLTTDLTGLEVTVTVPANRVLRITGQAAFVNQNDGAGGINRNLWGLIKEGGTELGYFGFSQPALVPAPATSALIMIQAGSIIITPTTGTHTYKLTGRSGGVGTGTCTIGGEVGLPAFILVEDIGPVNT